MTCRKGLMKFTNDNPWEKIITVTAVSKFHLLNLPSRIIAIEEKVFEYKVTQ